MTGTQLRDLAGQLLQCLADCAGQRLWRASAQGKGEQHAQGTESLERLVVKLTRPSTALSLRGLHGSTELVLGNPAGVADRDCRPVGENDGRFLVELIELLVSPLLGQVQVSVGLAANRDRDPEKRPHRRMVWG